MAKRKTSDIDSQPSFEQSLAKLEEIVHALEDGELGLEDSLRQYESGVKLLRSCYELLERAERRIEVLQAVDEDGKPVTTPLDDEAMSLEEKGKQRSRRRSSSKRPKSKSEEPSTPDDAAESDVDVQGGLF